MGLCGSHTTTDDVYDEMDWIEVEMMKVSRVKLSAQ